MKLNELASIAIGFIVLAGLTVTVVNGGNSAKVIGAGANGFANIIKASTLR